MPLWKLKDDVRVYLADLKPGGPTATGATVVSTYTISPRVCSAPLSLSLSLSLTHTHTHTHTHTQTRTHARTHVTPLLKELHWLPVKFRCQYKTATLAYRHFEGSLPPYLSSSLCTYEPSRSLRSSNEKLLKIPKRNFKSFGQRSFSFMAPSLWNSLPATLRNVPTLSQFKSQLKTLFAQAFL